MGTFGLQIMTIEGDIFQPAVKVTVAEESRRRVLPFGRVQRVVLNGTSAAPSGYFLTALAAVLFTHDIMYVVLTSG